MFEWSFHSFVRLCSSFLTADSLLGYGFVGLADYTPETLPSLLYLSFATVTAKRFTMPGGSKHLKSDFEVGTPLKGCFGRITLLRIRSAGGYPFQYVLHDKKHVLEEEVSDIGLPSQMRRLGHQPSTRLRRVKSFTSKCRHPSEAFASKLKGLCDQALDMARQSSPHFLELFGGNQLLLHFPAAPMGRSSLNQSLQHGLGNCPQTSKQS